MATYRVGGVICIDCNGMAIPGVWQCTIAQPNVAVNTWAAVASFLAGEIPKTFGNAQICGN